MTRDQLLLALVVDYGPLAAQLGITDTTSDYSPFAAATDRAARLLGLSATTYSDAGAQNTLDGSDWQDVAEVYLLRSLRLMATGQVDIEVQNSAASRVKKAYSQMQTQVASLLATAEQSAGWKTYSAPRFTAEVIGLDFLEPAPMTGMG